MQQYGVEWFHALLEQNPRWVRGTGTSATLVGSSNNTNGPVATFTSTIGLLPSSPLNISSPQEGNFVSWPQTAAIFKDAKHKKRAKLSHSFMLSTDYQKATGSWSVRRDVDAPAGYPDTMNMPGTAPTKFMAWMMDRPRVGKT